MKWLRFEPRSTASAPWSKMPRAGWKEPVDPAILLPYRGTLYPLLGEHLYRELARFADNHQGDIAVTNEWARMLRLKDWFHWVTLEEAGDDALGIDVEPTFLLVEIVNWRFSVADARIKLKHLYPS